jgi:ABC-2 type transport system ATP-binding protein
MPRPQTDAVVEFQDVVKDYTSGLLRRRVRRAVDRVCFQAFAGEVVGLVGPNRAGKTTLVKLLLSLCRPTRGQILRLGRPASARETLEQVGYVHERPAFPGYLTASELLDYYAVLAWVSRGERRRRIPALLDRVGLGDRRDEPISGFSKGMLQRLGLAQAILNHPELLVLDEPYEGLDLDGRRLVGEIVAEQRARGASVLLVSHVIPHVEACCDRIVVLVEGQVVHEGPIDAPIAAAERSFASAAEGRPISPADTPANPSASRRGPHAPRRPLEAALRELYRTTR